MTYLPKPFTHFHQAHEDIWAAFEELAGLCHSGPLDDRTRELVKLGIAIGAQSEGSIKSHTRRSLDLGVSPDELEHAVVLALTTIGFPEMIAARELVHEVLEAKE